MTTFAKTRFIKRYGTNVRVYKFNGVAYEEKDLTKSLLGRGNRTNSTMDLLENLREGIVPFDTKIDSGHYVDNLVNKETYLVGGMINEYGVNSTLSIVCNLLICNSKLELKGNRTVGDERGNLKTKFIVLYSDLKCSVQEVTTELKATNAGLLPDTECIVYSPLLNVTENDKLSLYFNGVNTEFKILTKDTTTFPNMLVMQVARDVRK